MSGKRNEQRLARALQRETGMPYTAALRQVRGSAGDAICKQCDRELRQHAGADHEFAYSGRNGRFIEGSVTNAVTKGGARQ